ncbi:hypothetical protein GRF29_1536g1223890 [Pseudopithomyces chartarum]|uniref:Uncharacterized protein n=1 Tax=Pseudopithomyces chartarum TaxID=1892770 RepID=A0AAN6LM89_9PLEO|nr:hypothetical protein GRF29_1536g1223890 [Pseudopithomyces chartarum]
MKFPARKKRPSMSAHMAATSPYGPRASTAVQEHTNAYDGEATHGFIQKYSLRRRNKSQVSRLDNECDAECVGTSFANYSRAMIGIGSSASLPLPILILMPASPTAGNPLPTRRRTVHSSSNGTQKKTASPPSEYANLSWKQEGGQETEDDQAETDADHAESNARPELQRETSKFLVPPQLDLDLGSEW